MEIRPKFLETEAGMIGVLREKKKGFARLGASVGSEPVVLRPEFPRPARDHKVD